MLPRSTVYLRVIRRNQQRGIARPSDCVLAKKVPQLSHHGLIKPLHLPISLGVIWSGIVDLLSQHVHHSLIDNGRELGSVIREDGVADSISGYLDVQ